MTKSVCSLALIAGLSLLPFNAARDDDEIKKARKDVLDVAADLEAGKDVTAKVAAIRKKYEDLNPIMQVFKPRERGGISGIRLKEKDDGIEKKLYMLAKRALSAKELEKARDDLVKAGWVCSAVARITHAYAPAKKTDDRGPKEWKQDLEAMEKASKSLIDAAKKGDPAALKKAATGVNNSCNNCHTVFRD